MAFRAVLFDMDGVVVDTQESVTIFWRRLGQEHGVDLSDADYDAHVYGCPASHTLDRMFPSLSTAQRSRVMEDLERYERRLQYAPIAGVIPLLNALARSGVPTALVTSGHHWKVADVTAQLGIGSLFSAIVTAEDIHNGKPDPECYLLAARTLKLPPDRCLVFEDAPLGVQAAVGAGAACIGVTPMPAARLLAVGACCTVHDFVEVRVDGFELRLPGRAIPLHRVKLI